MTPSQRLARIAKLAKLPKTGSWAPQANCSCGDCERFRKILELATPPKPRAKRSRKR